MLISYFNKYIIICGCSFLLFLSNSYAQSDPGKLSFNDESKHFCLSFYGTYVSSSQLQNDPRSPDPIVRNMLLDLKGGYGYGAEFDYKPNFYNLNLIFFLSSEYLRINEGDLAFTFNDGTNAADVSMKEDFTIIPVEAGVKWHLPVGTENFKIYIGGGGGVYFGNRIRTIANLQSTTISTQPGYSLNVLSGLEFYFARNLSANLELKFREAYFDVESSYTTNSIIINGTVFQIENPFYSRLIVDGVRISLGLNYHF